MNQATVKPSNSRAWILAVGGGKGGVGKSMVCSNLAVNYAQAGFKTVLIDLDLGAANAHTIFGIRKPTGDLGAFLQGKNNALSSYLLDTNVDNLQLISGSGVTQEMVQLKHFQKLKIINQIKKLDVDIVLLDLGAGSTNHVIDFFTISDASVVVTAPEPTAVINAYEFLKNITYRVIFRILKKQDKLLDLAKQSMVKGDDHYQSTIPDLIEMLRKESPWIADTIEEVCDDLDLYLVFNQSRKSSDYSLGLKLCDLCQKNLKLDLNFAGVVFHNEEVSASVYKMSPITITNPESITTKTLHRVATYILDEVSERMVQGKRKTSREKRLPQLINESKEDFTLNHLTQKRLLREREKLLG